MSKDKERQLRNIATYSLGLRLENREYSVSELKEIITAESKRRGELNKQRRQGWNEAQKPVLTNKGVEQKAPEHRKAALKNLYNETLREPLQAPSSQALSPEIKKYNGWEDVPANLKTKTQLGEMGLKPKNENMPVARVSAYYDTYNLFSVNDAVQKRKVSVVAPEPFPITVENIGLALYTINKAAKRRRDAAEGAYEFGHHGVAHTQKDKKERLYQLKDRVIKRAKADGIAKFEGVHTQTRNDVVRIYSDDEDDDWEYDEKEVEKTIYLACYSIANFRFHTPINKQPKGTVEIKNLGDWTSNAVPRGDLKIKDAEATLEKYLKEGLVA